MTQFFKILKQYADYSGRTMEARDHSKNGASLKSLTSRVNFLRINNLLFLILYCTFLTSCNKKIDEISDKPKYEIFINSNDQLFLQVTTDNGSNKMSVSGKKDENGNLLEISNIELIKGNKTYKINYSDGKLTELQDNQNNTIFFSYNEQNSRYNVSIILENADTIYHFQIPYSTAKVNKSRSLIKSNSESNTYYLRYKIKLEYVPEAPYAHFSTNYYAHKIKMYDDYVSLDRYGAELIETGGNYAIYQLPIDKYLENEATDFGAMVGYVFDFLDLQKFTLGELFSMLADGASGYYYNNKIYAAIAGMWNDAASQGLQQLMDDFLYYELDPYDIVDALHTNRKIGDNCTFSVKITGTGVNWQQSKQATISYNDLKQQQNKDVHLEITLNNIYPFKEVFMYNTGNTTYSVGDFYSKNGVAGIVYKVSSDEKHGMLISLQESIQDWYSAFLWCQSLGSGWHFPSTEELLDIYAGFHSNWTTINATISEYGGVPITVGTWAMDYGSSTVSGDSYNKSIWFETGYISYIYKEWTSRIRGVREF
jgi:hypothetical protein